MIDPAILCMCSPALLGQTFTSAHECSGCISSWSNAELLEQRYVTLLIKLSHRLISAKRAYLRTRSFDSSCIPRAIYRSIASLKTDKSCSRELLKRLLKAKQLRCSQRARVTPSHESCKSRMEPLGHPWSTLNGARHTLELLLTRM